MLDQERRVEPEAFGFDVGFRYVKSTVLSSRPRGQGCRFVAGPGLDLGLLLQLGADLKQQSEQALCLAIVVNAIIAWNTERVLDELRDGCEFIPTSEIELISPLTHQHIRLYAHYPFELATRPDSHRPLRTPAARTSTRATSGTPKRV
ncbi:MAG: Tn3 family transposase [Solirubrobacteraceae bacterium]